MGLNNVQSFAEGAAAAAPDNYRKATTMVMVAASSGNNVIYTVPSGKMFRGYPSHSQYNYPIKINDVPIWQFYNYNQGRYYNSTNGTADMKVFEAPAGTVFKSSSSGGYYVYGWEYDV